MDPISSLRTVPLQVDLPPDGISDSIRVRIGEAFKDFPKTHLSELSEKFSVMMSNQMKEGKTNLIELEMPEAVSADFLNYLETGHFNGENAVDLLILAHEHDIPELMEICLEFLAANLEIDQLNEVLELAVVLNNDNLKWICLSIAAENNKSVVFDDTLSKEAKEILECAKQHSSVGSKPCFHMGERFLLVPLQGGIIETILPQHVINECSKIFSSLSELLQWMNEKLEQICTVPAQSSHRIRSEKRITFRTFYEPSMFDLFNKASHLYLESEHRLKLYYSRFLLCNVLTGHDRTVDSTPVCNAFKSVIKEIFSGWESSTLKDCAMFNKDGFALFIKKKGVIPIVDVLLSYIANRLGIKDFIHLEKNQSFDYLWIRKDKLKRISKLLFESDF